MKLLLFLIIFILDSFSVYGSENVYITGSISRTRALAMGSAYTSVIDDFSAGLYNPGAFMLNQTREERSYRIFFNPIGMGVAFSEFSKYNNDYIRDDKLTFNESLVAASLLIKGAVYENQFFNFGFNLGEQSISTPDENSFSIQKKIFSIKDYLKKSFDSSYINFKISPTVTLGLSETIFRSRTNSETEYSNGYAFGVLIKPNPKLNVGVVYNDIPEKISKNRFEIESIEGETVMTGISYYPDEKSVLSIDLRNLNKDDKLAAWEIHTGIERRLGERIALRAGYFQQKDTNNNFYSFGIGILPAWEKISKYVNSSRTDLISYCYILEKNGKTYNYHLFSLLLKY